MQRKLDWAFVSLFNGVNYPESYVPTGGCDRRNCIVALWSLRNHSVDFARAMIKIKSQPSRHFFFFLTTRTGETAVLQADDLA